MIHDRDDSDTLQSRALQLLTGTCLEDKLVSPLGVADVNRQVCALPKIPGRPEELRLDVRRPKVPFPRLHADATDEQRGMVLHFFANHELLAIELMATFLLRFPDAPEKLRRDVAETIAEEQEHLRLYQGRMQSLGVRFGDIPVSPFFWDCLSTMHRPEQYLAGLSLTFEQANLDFSGQYMHAFERIGDTECHDVMRKVYEDEIGHVKVGAIWMQRLTGCSPAALWDTYRGYLIDPVTPSRGRGPVFDRAARDAAGLPKAFTDAVEVFGQSKGRVPVVRWFNVGAESIASGVQTLPAPLRAMQCDLGLLPLLIGRQGDAVIVDVAPPSEHLAALHRIGVPRQEIRVFDEGERATLPAGESSEPWAHTQDAAAIDPQLQVTPSICFRKDWANELRRGWVSECSESWTTQAHEVGEVCATRRSVRDATERRLCAGQRVVLKAPFGTAGRGAIRVFNSDELPKALRWADRVLGRQGAVVVEPWLDRLVDLGQHFFVNADGTVKVGGLTRSICDQRGQYLATWVGSPGQGLSSDVLRFLAGDGPGPWRTSTRLKALAQRVGAALAAKGHVGPASLDAFVFRHGDGSLRIRELVEINPRITMGQVADRCRRFMHRRSGGILRIVSVRNLTSAIAPTTGPDAQLCFESLSSQWSLPDSQAEVRDGRLYDGAILLTPMLARTQFAATLTAVPRGR